MKKNFFSFCVIFFFVPTALFAQASYKILENTYDRMSISFTFGGINVVDVSTREGLFSRIYMEGCGGSHEVGEPELPIAVNMLEIPIFGEYVLSVLCKDSVIYNAKELGINFPVYPAQPPFPKSHSGEKEFFLKKDTYQTDTFFAFPIAQFEEVGFMRNLNLGTLYVSPVQYNPVTHEILLLSEIEVEILFQKTELERTRATKELHKSPLFKPANIINPMANTKTDFSDTPIKYLIVAHEMFRGELEEFIAWKRRKGFMVEIGYTDDENVGTTTTSIANFITSHYLSASMGNPAPTFVLLVGDVEQIPTFMERGDANLFHATDLYYFTWEGGNIPSCYYGRFSAQNLLQLTPQMEKTLLYEQFTMPDPNYLNNICLIAGFDDESSPVYANGFVYYVSQNYATTAYGYTNVWAHFHPCTSDAELIRTRMGNGVGIANYTAHCDEEGWDNPAFLKGHISTMNNLNKYGLMIGNCCLSNRFDVNECFGEALLRAPGKGAVGYIGGSDFTYWGPDYYWAIGARNLISATPSYHSANLGAYDRLFHTKGEPHNQWMTTFGSMIVAGNEAVQASTTTPYYKKYYWEIYHLMGDPSVMTYLTKPKPMQVEIANIFNSETNAIRAKAAPHSYCALTYNNGSELVSAGFADAEGNITLHFGSFDPQQGTYEFAAWAQNYIQFFKTTQGVGVEDIRDSSKPYSVYPNPTNGKFTIEWTSSGQVDEWTSIEVFDVFGRKQKAKCRRQKAEREMVMDISHLPTGVYLLKITDSQQKNGFQKIIKH